MKKQQRIETYLSKNALGYANRKTSTDIRVNCNLEAGGPTNEHVRDLIRDMILNYGSCIGSLMWEDGYWIIQNEDELTQVIQSLKNRSDGVIRRAEALRRNWENRNNG
jgi:tRNA uridine 5-carbamoylmethylation protein Kti12